MVSETYDTISSVVEVSGSTVSRSSSCFRDLQDRIRWVDPQQLVSKPLRWVVRNRVHEMRDETESSWWTWLEEAPGYVWRQEEEEEEGKKGPGGGGHPGEQCQAGGVQQVRLAS